MTLPPDRRLHLFAPEAPPGYRRRRLAFAGLMLLATVAVCWPVYPLFSGVRPLLLGLPLSLAWVVGWLLVTFVALLMLYRSEP